MKQAFLLVWVIGFLLIVSGVFGSPAPHHFPSQVSSQTKPETSPPQSAKPSPAPETKPAEPAGQVAKASTQTLPGKMVLDDPDHKMTMYAGDKGLTPFDHEQHAKIEIYTCQTCHHTNSKTLTRKLEENVPHCTDCHKEEDSTYTVEGPLKDKTALNAKDAFHGKSDGGAGAAGCVICHKKLDKKVFPNVKDITSKCVLCHTGNDS